MAPPTNLTPLDDDFDDVEMKEEPLDMGQPVVPLELPSFLADHTYCIYNPTVPSLPRQLPEYVVTIPSERLSYAPEVPDSLRTLFKLLKVLPKKVSGSARLRSSTMKSFTPLGRIGEWNVPVCVATCVCYTLIHVLCIPKLTSNYILCCVESLN